MNKWLILVCALLLIGMSFASALPSQPSYRVGNHIASRYASGGTSVSLTEYPTARLSQTGQANTLDTNFDSTSLRYDYRGPLYEKTTTFSDDFVHDHSSKSGFFTSRSNNLLRHTVTNKVTERYVGATESLYMGSQNNRVRSSNSVLSIDYSEGGGFSYAQQRLFDRGEYGQDSYQTPYYYRPIQHSTGYYNWRY